MRRKAPWLRTPDTQAFRRKPRAAELSLQPAQGAGGPEPQVPHACSRPALGVRQGAQCPKPTNSQPVLGLDVHPRGAACAKNVTGGIVFPLPVNTVATSLPCLYVSVPFRVYYLCLMPL